MHHHAGGLVDDDQVVVFIENLQRDIFWQRGDIGGFFHRDFDQIILGQLRLGVGHNRAIHDTMPSAISFASRDRAE